MLRTNVHVNAAAAKGYYTEGLSRQDYYSEGQEVAGSWGGEGAKRLGLSGQVEQSDFASLCENLDPQTGKQLTPRSRVNRRVGYDFNFHCPKSVSALHALVGDARIVECFRVSVDETMRNIEKGMNTRIRKAGAFDDRNTGNMAWAEFLHFTGRPVGGVPDPHLHAHCFVFNATFDREERRWKAGEFAGIKNELEYHEAAFHLNLANRLQELGYQIERRGKAWEIAGVSKEVIDEFSRRTAQVEAIAKARGVTDAKLKDQLGAKSREKKQKSLSLAELKQAWQERISEVDFAAMRELPKSRAVIDGQCADSAKAAVSYAVDHCFAKKSVVPECKLRANALRRAIGSGMTAAAIERELLNAGLIRRQLNGRAMVTTAAVLDEEHRMLAFAKTGLGRELPLTSGKHHWSRDFLGTEQKAAVEHVLGSKDRVVVVRGGAGTGKTTLMSEAIEGIESSGKKVFTFAPSAIASRKVLREEGFRGAETVARLLIDAKLQQRLGNQVLWIDEAGLLSVRDMLAVFGVAARQNARVILSGDVRQHSAVDRGDALRILEASGAVTPAEINEIRRQRGQYKRAVEALSRGDTGQAFDILDRLGYVREVSPEQAAERISSDYLRTIRRGRSALVVSPTHREGEKASEAIRARLKSARMLGKREWDAYQQINLNRSDAEKTDVASYQPGDVVQFLQNVKGFARGERVVVTGQDQSGNLTCSSLAGVPQKTPLMIDQPKRFQVYRRSSIKLAIGERVRITQGSVTKNRCRLENGAIYTVKAFGPEGIEFDNGFKIPWDYGHLAHGYVATSHAAQGRTVDEVILAQGSDSLAASSREQFYVSASRGRQRLTIYTDNREALLEAVGASGARISANELVAEKPRKMSLFEKLGIKKPGGASSEKPDGAKSDEKKPEGRKSLFEKLGVTKAKEPPREPTKATPAVITSQPATGVKPAQPTAGEVGRDQVKRAAKVGADQWEAKAVKPTSQTTLPAKQSQPASNPVKEKPAAPKDTAPAAAGTALPSKDAAKGHGLFAPDVKQDQPKRDQQTAQSQWDSKTVKSPGNSPPAGAKNQEAASIGFAAKELQRRANNTDEDYRARAKVLNDDAAKSKAIKDVTQKQQELQKRHTANQIQSATKPSSGNPVVKGPHTAKLVAERKAAGKPAINQPAAAKTTPQQSGPAKAVPTKPVPTKPVPQPPRPPTPRGPRR